MTSVRDEELRLWEAEWRAEVDGTPDLGVALRRRVRRRSRGLVLMAVFELAMSAGAAWALTRLAFAPSHPADVPMAVGLLGVVALTAGFAFWNRRGLWRPQLGTVRDCVLISLRRARRRQRGLGMGWLILALEALVLLPWLLARGATGPWPVALLATLVGLMAAALALLRARTRREIAELEALSATLAED